MTLGEKLRQARLEAGLSQRQLSEGIITRNMLSQIENGAANPSVSTLRQLAQRLEMPMICFLEPERANSPNADCILAVRELYKAGRFPEALQILDDFREPDDLLHWEKVLLGQLLHLALAEKALEDGRTLYARQILALPTEELPWFQEALLRRRMLLLGRLDPLEAAASLPGVDEDLLIRAAAAVDRGEFSRAEHLLEAMEGQDSAQWHFLRGKVFAAQGARAEALAQLEQAQQAFPRETLPLLEECARELGDYRRAYEYACALREEMGKHG